MWYEVQKQISGVPHTPLPFPHHVASPREWPPIRSGERNEVWNRVRGPDINPHRVYGPLSAGSRKYYPHYPWTSIPIVDFWSEF
jgi:hypothetical protein